MNNTDKNHNSKDSENSSRLSRRKILKGAGAVLGTGFLISGQVTAGISKLGQSVSVKNPVAKNEVIVYTHTTVVTGDPNKAALKDVALAVKGGKIAAIGETDSVLKQFPNAEVIDGTNKALLPGVTNCHAHLSASIAKGFNEDYSFPNRSGLEVRPSSFLSEEEKTLMSVIASIHSIRTGTTTVVEYTGNIAPEAPELAKTGLRWVFAEGVNDRIGGGAMSPEKFAESSTPEYSAKDREEGMQRIQDLYNAWHGKNNGKIQVFPAVRHTENASPELLKEIRSFAEKYDLNYTIHLNQTYAEIQYMLKYHNVYPSEYLYNNDFLGPNLFVGHARYVNELEIEMLGKTKTMISHQAAMASNRGVSPPIPALRAAGCPICLGTDNNNNDMFAVMKLAMLTERIKRNDVYPGMYPQPEDILYDAAFNGAKATRQEDKLGLLEEGKIADIIVLNTLQAHLVPSGRILSAWLHNGMPSDVESVIVDGEFIMKDHKILTLDEEAIVKEAAKIGERAWTATEKANPVVPPGRTNWI